MSFIPVNVPSLSGNERKYLLECIDSGWISSEGPFVEEFEKKFAARMGRKHGIAVSNGTAALDAAVEALGIGPGDEVIVPTFTIISCLNQIVRNGATPVLVDSDPVTWNMDVTQIRDKITERTKAIMAVHTYGLPVDMDPVLEIAAEFNLKVIEDAAEVHGQTYKGRPCGSMGDISTFSFYPNKHITTGEGGMILTDDDQIAEDCRSLRNLCFEPEERFVHRRLGWNMRLTNMQAALGLAQLEQLDEFLNRKRVMGEVYREILVDSAGINLPLVQTEYAVNVYWVFGIVLCPSLGLDSRVIGRRLAAEGIGSRPFFCPMHLQPIFKRMGLFKEERLPVSESLWKLGFYLPSGLGHSTQSFQESALALKRVLHASNSC